MKKYILTFHEIMDNDFTAITLKDELGNEWSNTEEKELYTNQKKELEMDGEQLQFLINTLELTLKMKEQLIDNDSEYVYIECPCCDNNLEAHPIDEQRHHIQTFDIIKWDEGKENEPEVSVMSCHGCKGKFKLIWEYKDTE